MKDLAGLRAICIFILYTHAERVDLYWIFLAHVARELRLFATTGLALKDQLVRRINEYYHFPESDGSDF